MNQGNTALQIGQITKEQTSEKNTWNIIFIAVDINEQYKDINESYDGPIQLGIDQFKADMEATPFAENLKFFMLDYRNIDVSGDAKAYKSNSTGIKFKFDKPEILRTFNCHQTEKYFRYFKSLGIGAAEKKIIIFLAHSFGAGLIYHYDTTDKHYPNKFFTTIRLNKAINSAFGSIDSNGMGIDCLLSVNCTLQSIETNYIFRDTAKFLIGSQQELYPETITYKSLFFDLQNCSFQESAISNKGLSDEILFIKFIQNCHEEFLKKGNSLTVPFCLTLTRPEKAKYLMAYLNAFSITLNKIKGNNDEDFLLYAKNFCADPNSSNLVNIIDAKQFFTKLQEYFKNANNVKYKSLQFILNRLHDIIIFHLVTGPNAGKIKKFASILKILNKKTSFFIPNGLGIYIEKINSENGQVVLPIYEKLIDDLFSLDINVFKNLESYQREESDLKEFWDSLNIIPSKIETFKKGLVTNYTSMTNTFKDYFKKP